MINMILTNGVKNINSVKDFCIKIMMLGVGVWIMSKVLLGVVAVLLAVSYYLYSQNQILQTNNAVLEGAVATQEEAIKSIQADFELQTQQLQDLSVKSQKAQRELSRYTQFIQNYELASKILADPVEMERKINNGTKHIMENIEQISSTIDGLDSGLQLQPTSN
jgi:chromosome condensin MukBEF ATPase and DNA-binding subunit MukB